MPAQWQAISLTLSDLIDKTMKDTNSAFEREIKVRANVAITIRIPQDIYEELLIDSRNECRSMSRHIGKILDDYYTELLTTTL